MSPVDPRELASTAGGAVILTDRACPVCEYNLRGLRVGMRCPECGHPVKSISAVLEENFTDAPIGYLKSLRFAFALMLGGFLGTTLSILIVSEFSQLAARGAALGCAGAWWLGVYIATEPRRRSDAPAGASANERRVLRAVNRATQGGWVVWLLIQILISTRLTAGTTPHTVAMVAATVVSLVALVGLVPLLIHLMDFAHWSGNSELADRLRLCAWGLGIFGSLQLLTPAIGAAAQVTSGILALPFAMLILVLPFTLFLFLASEVLFLVCLFQLWHSARWAVRNWASAREKERRQRERAERIAASAAVAPLAEPVSLSDSIMPGPMSPRPSVERSGPARPLDPYDLEPEPPGG